MRRTLQSIDGGYLYRFLQLSGISQNSKPVTIITTLGNISELTIFILSIIHNDALTIGPILMALHSLISTLMFAILTRSWSARFSQNTMAGNSMTARLVVLALLHSEEDINKVHIINSGGINILKCKDEDGGLWLTPNNIRSKSFKNSRTIATFFASFFLATYWLHIFGELTIVKSSTMLSETLILIKTILLILMIAKSFFMSLFVTHALLIIMMTIKVVKQRVVTIKILVKKMEIRRTNLSIAEVRSLVAAIREISSITRSSCQNFNTTLKNFVVLGSIALLSLVTGLLLNDDDHSDGILLVPFYVVWFSVGTATVFLAMITNIGLANIQFASLFFSVSDLVVTLRDGVAKNEEEGGGGNEESIQMTLKMNIQANLLSSLLDTDKTVATVVGVPIMPKMLATLWGEIGIGVIIAVQFFVRNFDSFFSFGYTFVRIRVN